MMEDAGSLAALMARTAGPGRVEWIGVRPSRRAPVETVAAVAVTPGGLAGDRNARPGKRAVTLVQAEHLAVIAGLARAPWVRFADLRRNLAVAGVNLAGLRGRRVRIGTAVLEITGPCAPCSRMEEALGPGGYAALRGHGGMTAAVVEPGRIALADPLLPL